MLPFVQCTNDEKRLKVGIMYLLFQCVEIPPRSLQWFVDLQLVTILRAASHQPQAFGIPLFFCPPSLPASDLKTHNLVQSDSGASHNRNGACLLIGHILETLYTVQCIGSSIAMQQSALTRIDEAPHSEGRPSRTLRICSARTIAHVIDPRGRIFFTWSCSWSWLGWADMLYSAY